VWQRPARDRTSPDETPRGAIILAILKPLRLNGDILTRFMNVDLLHYLTGEEVHAGDRVQYNGTYGRVVFVSDGTTEEYSSGYEDYLGTDRGILICDDDGGSTFISEPGAELSFIDRG
jgi:hypothetical protein